MGAGQPGGGGEIPTAVGSHAFGQVIPDRDPANRDDPDSQEPDREESDQQDRPEPNPRVTPPCLLPHRCTLHAPASPPRSTRPITLQDDSITSRQSGPA